jgi:hypothetical protein
MYLAFLLDFFQPPAQSYDVIDQITRECYLPLVELFNCDLNPRFTVSLANSLGFLFEEYGKDEVTRELRRAIENGKAELVNSGSSHPIFPLIPEQEVRRQIGLDIEFKRANLGVSRTAGIFSPELCYDDNLVDLYRDMRFTWTLVDDQVMAMNGIPVPEEYVFQIADLAVLMRNSFWSERIRRPKDTGWRWTGKEFVEYLDAEAAQRTEDCYRIIALAGETFGHHLKYYQETFLRDMLFALKGCESVRLLTISELLTVSSLPKVAKAREQGKKFAYFPRCSWATRPEDYQRGDFYPHWQSKGNAVHAGLWELSGLILEACRDIDFENDANNKLRVLLDGAFYSTQYYWASLWFWRPERIYEGIDGQMRALYACARLTRNSALLESGKRVYTRLMWEIDKANREHHERQR